MPELRRDRAADVRLITGSTGSGKTWYVQQAIAQAMKRRHRVIVWDWKDDHYKLPTVTLPELARRSLRDQVLRVLPLRVDVDRQFALFCRIAWATQEADPRTDCYLVVEEASKVLRAGVRNAPWENIVEVGRVYGFTLLVTTQRPAYVDLGFRGAANFVRCGRLGEEEDARVMGRRLGVPYGDIQRLPDHAAYEFDGRKTVLVKPRALRT